MFFYILISIIDLTEVLASFLNDESQTNAFECCLLGYVKFLWLALNCIF